MGSEKDSLRINEWFVPKFGPMKFRLFMGLLFLPYTGICVSYTVIGSMLAPTIFWDRTGAIALIYFLALGIAAHALDGIGSKRVKPWGTYFSKKQLWILSLSSLTLAYAIGIYFMVLYVPLLGVIAIAEGFFVFAYNMEWFNGKFHTDSWFAFSWGVLPLLAGYIIQTNNISILAFAVAAATGFASYIEIKTSRPYKALKRGNYDRTLSEEQVTSMISHYERILKSLSIGIISVSVILVVLRGIIL
ncbi:MAG: hypothetical protein ACE5KA_07835 [Nitrososphaerales archaeon]